MFAPDPRFRHVPVTRDQVVAVFGSLNRPRVAIPGKVPQEAQAYVVGAAGGKGRYAAFIYLLLLPSLETVIYLDQDRPQLAPEEYPDAEAEALGFVESMGFMLEPLNFRALTPAAQEELMRTLPCFSANPREAAAVATMAPTADENHLPLARLLAAF